MNRRDRDENEIVTIRDAISRFRRGKTKFNLAGFVLEFTFPRKSKGTDYVERLKITDEHMSEITVSVFSTDAQFLPRLRSYKDFIVLYNVTIEKVNEEFCVVFNKKFSSFGLYDGNSLYQEFPGFNLLRDHRDVITRMRRLSDSFQSSAGSKDFLISIKNLGTRDYFDLVCQVLRMQEVSDDKLMFYVWDGSDYPPLNVQERLEDERSNPLPLQVEAFPLHISTVCHFPRVGSVLRIEASKSEGDFSILNNYIGRWVKIRNMSSCTRLGLGLWYGRLVYNSRVRLLSDNDDIVVEHKRAISERGLGMEGRLPLWGNSLDSLTVLDCVDAPIATLMDLLSQNQVGVTFRCGVRVMAICPAKVEDFHQSGEYKIRLTLEDPTTRIHAFLCGHDGDRFFRRCVSDDDIALYINKLLGVLENCNIDGDIDYQRNPPWIECCIELKDDNKFYLCKTLLV
ncbi:hypothetical protein UlMin_043912 [Ulmus minor]